MLIPDILSIIAQFIYCAGTAHSLYMTSRDARIAIFRDQHLNPRRHWLLAWAILAPGKKEIDTSGIRFMNPDVIIRAASPGWILPVIPARKIRGLPAKMSVDDFAARGFGDSPVIHEYLMESANIFEIITARNIPARIIHMRINVEEINWTFISQLELSATFAIAYHEYLNIETFCEFGNLEIIPILRRFSVPLNWSIICGRDDLTLEFLNRNIGQLHWPTLSRNIALPNEFILENYQLLNMSLLSRVILQDAIKCDEINYGRILKLSTVLEFDSIHDIHEVALFRLAIPALWNEIAVKRKLSQHAIRFAAIHGLLDFYTAIRTQILTEKTIIAFGKLIDFDALICSQKLSEHILRKYMAQICKRKLCKYQKLRAEFIDEYADVLDFGRIAKYQKCPSWIIHKYEHKFFQSFYEFNMAHEFTPELLRDHKAILDFNNREFCVNKYAYRDLISCLPEIGWTRLAEHRDANIAHIRANIESVNWTTLSCANPPIQVLREFADRINWISYVKCNKINEDVAREFADRINFAILFDYHPELRREDFDEFIMMP